MISGEAIDVILRIQGLRSFQSGMNQAAVSVRQVGTASAQASAQANAGLNSQLGLLGLVRKAAIGVGIAFVAAGIEAYKLNTEFDRQMTMVQAEAGASAQEVANMRKEILASAGELRQSPIELAKGLYHVESLGFRGAHALEILRDAAHMANISGADLEETTTALGGAMIVGVRGAGSLRNVMGTLVATAGAGNMRMQNLNEALGTGLLSAAKNANMTLQDTGAALATLTDTGMPASSAAAQLRTALHFLYSPTKRARDALNTLGISQRDLVEQIAGPDGLAGALNLLNVGLDTYAQGDNARKLDIFGHILPGGRGQVLLTLMKNLDQYKVKHKQIADTIGHTETGIRISEETNSAKLRGAWADLQAQLIEVADVYKNDLTGAITAVIGGLAGLASFLNDHHNDVIHVSEAIMILIGAWVLYRTVMVTVIAITAIWNAMLTVKAFLELAAGVRSLAEAWILLDVAMEANPIIFLITLVILLVGGLVILYLKWQWFHNAVDNTFNFLKTHWYVLGAILMGLMGPMAFVAAYMVTHWQQVKEAAIAIWHAIAEAFNNKVHSMAEKIRAFVKFATEAWDKVKGPLDWVVGATGDVVHAGATVLGGSGSTKTPLAISPAARLSPVPIGPSMWEPRKNNPAPIPKTSGVGGAKRTDEHIHVYLDGKEIESNVNKRKADRKARG